MRRSKIECEETRRSIIYSALDLFVTHGVMNTTMDMIAMSVNLTRSGVYWHFKGKEKVLEAVLSEKISPACYLKNNLLEWLKSSSKENVLSVFSRSLKVYARGASFEGKVARICYLERHCSLTLENYYQKELDIYDEISSLMQPKRENEDGKGEKCIFRGRGLVTLWRAFLREAIQSSRVEHALEIYVSIASSAFDGDDFINSD